jgi:beta-glucosidase
MSDWGAIRDRVRALAAGVDLEMPGPRAHRVRHVVDAVLERRLPEAVVDAAAERIVRLGERVADRPTLDSFDAAEHHALARRAASEGMVLLKNDGVLPLRPGARVAVIGRAACEPHYQGMGSSHITPTRLDEPLAEIRRMAGSTLVDYAEGYTDSSEKRTDLIDDAIAVAEKADVAVVFVTVPAWKEIEGADRTDINLPDQQVQLIKSVAAVQPRTVVVLNNGSAVAMAEWVDDVAAVLEAWMMGQAGGGAVADVLSGLVNPSGKLAETFPLRLEDTPAHLNFPGDKDVVRYAEGLFIGYRWYDARDIRVQFPFGHGLSYTSFEYANLQVAHNAVDHRDGLTLNVDVTNVGGVAGKEVVQVYVRERAPRLQRPDRELKGFAKVSLAPGETTTVTISLGRRAFMHFDPLAGWVSDAGDYDLLVGASSRDIRLTTTVRIRPDGGRATDLGRYSTLGDWLNDPLGRPGAEQLLDELGPALARALGSEPDDPHRPSELALTFLESMPVATVVDFAASPSALGTTGDEVVDALLARLEETPPEPSLRQTVHPGKDPADESTAHST